MGTRVSDQTKCESECGEGESDATEENQDVLWKMKSS